MTKLAMGKPWIDRSDERAVLEALRSGQLALGARAEEFERELAAYVGTKHAVAVSSGTAGLHLAVLAAGVQRDDEVITTPFSFVASTNCFLYEGARPRFVDIDPSTLMPTAEAMEAAVTPRTRALLSVDVFGNPADADGLRRVARRHGLALIEDSCEALGSEYKGRRAGSLGDVAVFGFYPNKQITTGEGGMVVTDRPRWAATLRALRNQGREVHDAWLTHSRVGFNYRLDELSAALGLSQLRRIEKLLKGRERVAKAYRVRLSGLELLEPPRPVPTTTRMSWFAYVIRLAPGLHRDEVMRELANRGVPTRGYFSPLHLQPAYRERFGFREGQFPVTEDMSRRCLALPFHPRMTQSEVDAVCEALKAVTALRGVRRGGRAASRPPRAAARRGRAAPRR